MIRRRIRARSDLALQMVRANRESKQRLRQHRIEQLLAILQDDHLAAGLAASPAGSRELSFECGFAKAVWTAPEINNRIEQLSGLGIETVLEETSFTFGGTTLTRPLIKVRLQ